MLDMRLETFIAVCDYRNFTRAADAMGLTQPAVSRQMKGLEEYYGVQLFTYEGKKLVLTRAAKLLYRYARAAKSDELRLRARLREQAPGKLRLGSTPTPGEFMLPRVLAGYLQEYPSRDIYLTIQNTESLLNRLDCGEIDIAVVEGNFSKQEYAYLHFADQRYFPVCAADGKPADGSMEGLLARTLIVREPGSGNREILEYSLKRCNISLTDFAARIEVNDIKVQKALVEQGCGIAFLFAAAVEGNKQLKEIPLDGFPLEHEINLVWRKDSVFQEEYLELAGYFAQQYAQENENK